MHKRHVRTLIIAITVLALLSIVVIVTASIFFNLNKNNTSNQSNPPTPSKPQTPQKTALSCIESLPESVQIGQKIMAAGYSDQLASSQPTFLQYGIGGVIIMDEAPSQTISSFKKGFLISPTIAVDQEGGTVQRYKSGGLIPGATDMAANYTTAQAYQSYYTDAQYLNSIGITTNFGPVLDVISAEPSALPGRMYSSNPTTVTQYATQFILAYKKASITPVVKHFPGLGSTTTNTDAGSATTSPLTTLKTSDIIPYQKLAQYNTDAMVSNAIVPDLTEGQPAVWSSAALSLLRSYGYQNAVIYTDSLTAKAIPGTIEDAAIKSWQAGNDVALIVQEPNDTATLPSIFEAINNKAVAALQSGELDKQKFSESVLRILNRKNIDPCTIVQE